MEILQAAVLGLIQGTTEILPISSSGHLVLAPWLFNFSDPGLAFNVALHLGTLGAVIAFFCRDLIKVLKGGLELVTKKDPSDPYQKLFVFLSIATIPGILAGVILEDKAETIFRSPLLIAFTLFFFGLILLFVDKMNTQPKVLEKLNLKDSFLVGLSQALAIIPGVSRSGVTISMGIFRKLNREDAARFSFLLSVPIIFGAAAYSLAKVPLEILVSPIFLVGFLTAFISSFLAIKFLISFIKTRGFSAFAYYRFALAFIIIIFYFLNL